MSKYKDSEEWEKKLKRLETGDLSTSEAEKFEKELEKLETLQQYMDDKQETKHKKAKPPKYLNLKKTKWKLRLEQVGTIIAAFLLFTFFCSVITNLFFMTGDREVLYNDVVERAFDITKPGIKLSSSSGSTSPYFTKSNTYTINKQVGSDTQVIGDLTTKHFFANLSIEEEYYENSAEMPQFYRLDNEISQQKLTNEWSILDKISDVSVSNVYITFDKTYSTEEVNSLFEDYDVEILFYPVETGSLEDDIAYEPIGFSNEPMWLEEDWTLESEKKEGNTSSATYSAPAYEEGDTEMLQQQFIKVLHFLEEYSKQTRELNYSLRPELLTSTINYLNEHGIHHYGAVITGPTSEIMKMQDEEFIYGIDIDESVLYNWDK